MRLPSRTVHQQLAHGGAQQHERADGKLRGTQTLWDPSWRSLSSEVVPGFEGPASKGPREPLRSSKGGGSGGKTFRFWKPEVFIYRMSGLTLTLWRCGDCKMC